MISSGGSGTGGRGRESSSDFDLNLAPIIDCFTVIIAFLLASAAFVSIGVFEAAVPSIAPQQGQSEQAQTSSLDVIAEVGKDKNITLSWSGVKTGKQVVSTQGGRELEGFRKELQILRESVQKEVPGSLEIRASDEAVYADLISVLEAARPSFPAVILGGL
jgi:biopolymer transport protein ExbD